MRTVELWDADNHYYEPRDCFTRYIEPGMADRAIRVETDDAGREAVLVDDRPFTFLLDPFRETTTKPGALREMLRSMSSGTTEETTDLMEPVQPAYVDRDARLALMDAQGV
ncbi:MAG TPA: amidohydrolase, partial [Acidimicrobiia bacterium]|nr:amidohydrolase [Acidimicrobiia bacterium]